MPPVKEIHFFNERARSHETSLPPRIATARARVEVRELAAHVVRSRDLRAIPWGWRYFFRRRDIDWYRGVLTHPSRALSGDITPAYSTLSEPAVRQLAEELPGVRAVLLLRNPIDRAFSHAVMDLSPLAPDDVLSLPAERFYEHFRSPESVTRTGYVAMIDRWQRVLGAERLLVAFFEEVSEAPARLLEKVTDFLGVASIDWASRAPVDARVNAGQRTEMPAVYREYLAGMYRGEMTELARRYPTYPQQWLRAAP